MHTSNWGCSSKTSARDALSSRRRSRAERQHHSQNRSKLVQELATGSSSRLHPEKTRTLRWQELLANVVWFRLVWALPIRAPDRCQAGRRVDLAGFRPPTWTWWLLGHQVPRRPWGESPPAGCCKLKAVLDGAEMERGTLGHLLTPVRRC